MDSSDLLYGSLVKKWGDEAAQALITPVYGGSCEAQEMLIYAGGFLNERLEEVVSGIDLPEGLLTASNANSKWRLASCMQKAIRRGDVEMAMNAAHALSCIDEPYLYRRLAVTAIEDIGVANMAAMALTLVAATDKVLRTKLGTVKTGVFLARELAIGLKDRTACEMWVMVDCGDPMQEKRQLYETQSLQAMLALVRDVRQPIEYRMLAACMAQSSSLLWRTSFTHKTGSTPALLDTFARMGMPLIAYYCADKLGKKIAEALFTGLAFICESMVDEIIPVEVVSEPLPEAVKIGHLISPTYDMHTREGKAAFRYFRKMSDAVRRFEKEHGVEETDAMMSAGVFCGEGGRLDRRISTPFTEKVLELSRTAEYGTAGLSIPQGEELCSVIVNNLDQLNYARRKIVLRQA